MVAIGTQRWTLANCRCVLDQYLSLDSSSLMPQYYYNDVDLSTLNSVVVRSSAATLPIVKIDRATWQNTFSIAYHHHLHNHSLLQNLTSSKAKQERSLSGAERYDLLCFSS